MQKLKKYQKRLIALFTICITISIVHFIVFPEESRCILIKFYDFQKDENIYYRENVDQKTIVKLKQEINHAKTKVKNFWGSRTIEPIFIYCESKEDYKRFGVPFNSPACNHMKLGSYIVISSEGMDINILAHEISHSELYQRIGFFKKLNIPIWFDEGLAMQVDERPEYDLNTLENQKLLNWKEINNEDSLTDFGSNNSELSFLNYLSAKQLISDWYSPQKLFKFIEKIKQGESFQSAYDGVKK